MVSKPSRGNPAANFFIVGIGASAGGVQALESFFANVPDNPNAAFVIVQHLSPNHKSLMAEILQRQTEMVVQTAEDQMQLEPAKVYLLPPRKSMEIKAGRLHLQDRGESFGYPINRFFNSLAKDWGERTIAILLSGTGKDGTEGLQAISRVGGVALVQSPETAQFTSMPTPSERSASDASVSSTVRFLIAEDNADNRDLITLLLEELGYTDIETANNGRELLEKTAADTYDIILMDCQMPEVNGYDATRQLRQQTSPNRDLPVIGLTANAMPGDREKCLAAGMNDYVSKPLTIEDLAIAIGRWVGPDNQPIQ